MSFAWRTACDRAVDNGSVPGTFDADVQLGEYEVPADIMNSPGSALEDLIGTPAAALVDDLLGAPPDNGWRLIAGDLTAPTERQPVLAAPWTSPRSNGWIVIRLSQSEGAWHASIASDRRPIRQSRARRREGLHLSWTDAAVEQAANLQAGRQLGPLAVTLTNTSDTRWANDGWDDDCVTIHVADERGRPIQRRGVSIPTAIEVAPLPPLEPDEQRTLTAHFIPPAVDLGPQAGTATISLIANLVSLRLFTTAITASVASAPS